MSENDYTKRFDPRPFVDLRSEDEKAHPELGDRRDGKVYRYKPSIVLAVNVALVTGRPLLVRGPSGSGKSSLAYNVARVLKRKYYEFVITSRTQAQDLLWRFDAVRRLGDAQTQRIVMVPTAGETAPAVGEPAAESPSWRDFYRYIEPGVLWWVLNPETATRRGYPDVVPPFELAQDPAVFVPEEQEGFPVLLLDEIDKADPDFANNLLVPIGSLQFRVDEVRQTIARGQQSQNSDDPIRNRPLVIITTNEERRLPQAFLRRCVSLELEGPGPDGLVEIATKLHGSEHEALYRRIVESMTALVRERLGTESFFQESDGDQEKVHLNVAQFLDSVQACLRLTGLEDDEQLFTDVLSMTTWKERTSNR